ncbi:hypothetical protein L3i23_04750 [Herbiconiux sp. L3-i23]|nr:hypothetical protein L3i23_04750 [Herbiconiux sp. L3-i23]
MARSGRLRRVRVDSRLIIGATLVIGSVVGVVALVGALDSSVLVYSATRPLSVGDRIGSGDLAVADVRLGSLESGYVRAEELPAAGSVVLRPVDAGELIPLASLGSPDGLDVAAVVVQTEAALPRDVRPGGVVDVWSAAALDLGAYGPPKVLAPDATVVRTIEGSGSAVAAAVELLVARDDLAAVLAAIANADAVSLVPEGVALEESS